MKEEKIKEIINKKETVSFDVFDTLLFRNIYKPVDIFKIMEPEVSEKYGISDFAKLRVDCEAASRNEKNKNETSLDEIYDLIGKKIEKDVSKIKKREIELELEFIVANPFIKDIFDYAVEKKKKIVLISDVYLPSDVMKKLVKKAGYKDVPIYISCEYHAGKGTTELYEVVCKSEKLNKNTWVHIGDNKYSDYEKAKEFGIDAIVYENIRSKDKLGEPKTIESSIIRGIQNNYLYNGNEVTYWEKFGVLYASPIYYGFTNWLFKLTKDKDNLFFLARDGYIIEKIYDDFKKNEGSKINTHYLYCSRKVFQLPALLHKTKDELMDFLVSFTEDYSFDVTIGDILSNLDLEYEKYKDKMGIFGFDGKDDKIDKNNFHQVKKFLKYVYDDIEEDLKRLEKLALKYMKQEGLCDYDKINIMDVGWGGSLQEAIRILTEKDVMGYYFGTIPTKKVDILSNSLGYVFDEAKPDKYYIEIFNMPMMYEFVFSAPHGTTTGLKQEGNKVLPIIDKNDKAYTDIVNILQDSALKVIKTYLLYAKYLSGMSVEDSIGTYSDMIVRRDFEDLKQFAKLTNSALYTNKKNNYIDVYDEDYIYNYHDEFSKSIHKAMWGDSYLVKGVETKQQWDEHKQRLNRFLLHRRVKSVGKKAYIKEGIKNPKKVVKLVKRAVIRK